MAISSLGRMLRQAVGRAAGPLRRTRGRSAASVSLEDDLESVVQSKEIASGWYMVIGGRGWGSLGRLGSPRSDFGAVSGPIFSSLAVCMARVAGSPQLARRDLSFFPHFFSDHFIIYNRTQRSEIYQ
mgnify:CR=1 FL=1